MIKMPKKENITLSDLAQLMVEGFNHIANRFDGFDKKIDQLDLRLSVIEKRISHLEIGLVSSEKTLEQIERRLAMVEVKLGKIDSYRIADLHSSKERIAAIESRLDNLEKLF